MALQLVAALKATLAKETDPTKRALLTASIEAYKKSKHTIEKHETEEGDEEEEEEEEEEKGGEGEEKKAEDGGDDDGEESKKSSKKSELSDDDDDDGDEKDSDDEDEDEEEDEEEEEEAKASLALVRDLSGGLKGSAARGALKALVGTALQAAKDVAALKREKRDEEKASLIASLKGKANKLELAWLRDQDLKAVRSFVKMRAKSGFVMTGEDQLIKPKHTAPDSYEALPESSRAMVDAAVQTVPGDAAAKETFKATLVKKLHAAENANSVRRF